MLYWPWQFSNITQTHLSLHKRETLKRMLLCFIETCTVMVYGIFLAIFDNDISWICMSVFGSHCRSPTVTSCMKYQYKKRSLHVCTLSSLKMLTLRPAWTSSKTTWSTQKPKLSKPQVAGHTSLRISLRRNSDSSEYKLNTLHCANGHRMGCTFLNSLCD